MKGDYAPCVWKFVIDGILESEQRQNEGNDESEAVGDVFGRHEESCIQHRRKTKMRHYSEANHKKTRTNNSKQRTEEGNNVEDDDRHHDVFPVVLGNPLHAQGKATLADLQPTLNVSHSCGHGLVRVGVFDVNVGDVPLAHAHPYRLRYAARRAILFAQNCLLDTELDVRVDGEEVGEDPDPHKQTLRVVRKLLEGRKMEGKEHIKEGRKEGRWGK